MFEISQSALEKLTGLSGDEFKATFYKEGGEELIDNPSAKLVEVTTDKFMDAGRTKSEQLVSKALKKRMTTIETALSPILKKLGVEKAEKVEETLADVAEQINGLGTGSKGTKPEDLTADDIAKLPAFQGLLDSKLAAKDQAFQALESKHNEYVSGVELSKKKTALHRYAQAKLKEDNPIWGDDPQGKIEKFFRMYGYDGFKIEGEGKGIAITMVDSNGNPLRDKHENRVKFDSWLKTEWQDTFGFHEAPQGGGSPGAQRGGQGGGGTVIVTSDEDFKQKFANATTNEEKQALFKANAERLANQG